MWNSSASGPMGVPEIASTRIDSSMLISSWLDPRCRGNDNSYQSVDFSRKRHSSDQIFERRRLQISLIIAFFQRCFSNASSNCSSAQWTLRELVASVLHSGGSQGLGPENFWTRLLKAHCRRTHLKRSQPTSSSWTFSGWGSCLGWPHCHRNGQAGGNIAGLCALLCWKWWDFHLGRWELWSLWLHEATSGGCWGLLFNDAWMIWMIWMILSVKLPESGNWEWYQNLSNT